MSYQFKRSPLSPEDADKMYAACENIQEKLIVWTLLETGLRIGELCALKVEDVLWQQRSLKIVGKGGPFGKKSKARIVPMSEKVFKLLEHYFATHDKWFIKKRMAQRIIKIIANRARITAPVSAHVLRHTFACQAASKGVPMNVIQMILGHDRLSTTMIYLRYTNPMLVEEFLRKW